MNTEICRKTLNAGLRQSIIAVLAKSAIEVIAKGAGAIGRVEGGELKGAVAITNRAGVRGANSAV